MAEHSALSSPSVAAAFDKVATLFGDSVAVREGANRLSYADLQRRADELAAKLVLDGISPGEPVGVICERRPELIVALLAILKAGGSYLPFDTAYPPARLNFMAKDAGVRLVLGSAGWLADSGITVVPFEDFPTEVASGDFTPELGKPGRNDPAYLLYTSGSTGQPKGVLVPHRAILRLVIDQDYCDLGPGTKMLQHSPIAFDASTFEIWGTLLNGGELVLFPEAPLTLRSLGKAVRENGINTLWLTAGLFHAMVDERIDDLAGVTQLLAGGDILSPARAEAILTRFPNLALINGYGPTENTTFTCCHRITLADITGGLALPIGRPIHGTGIRIVDENLKTVTPGTCGELCATGEGLALGYWKREDLTRERFVNSPQDKNVLLYRTGDLAREDENGVIHFEGRLDQQVKVRGFRLELAEIEAALESHDAIRQAVVIAAETPDGTDKVLSAWLVAPNLPERSELLHFLEARLPDYAIPAFYHAVEEIPLTPNGKVDRKALRVPIADGGATVGRERGGLVQSIVAEITGLTNPAADANFFDLGMSSLQIARAHERLEKALEREFPITNFFLHTTIRTLSEFLEKGETSCGERNAPARRGDSSDIAIVGMAGRFPGAPDIDTFWKNLLAGRETISHFAAEELEYCNDPKNGTHKYVRARGIVEGSDLFDAKHFGIPPREAEVLDPQHRLLLECAQEALENAGHDPDRFDGKIGIFSGSSQNSYLLNNLCADRAFARKLAAGYPVNDFGILFGNDKDFLPTRIAYKLNLKGPAMAIQCACSTSLIAVTQACESLRSGSSDMALAGGVSLTFPQKRDYLYTPEGMASADGHCRSFDAGATGTVFGEGVGLVVLRRLDDAIADGDEIIAVIKGYAQNNDGADKVGYAAPSVSGQVAMVLEAHRNAGVEARSIGYIEAHGTGTPLGDPIEVAALSEAFAKTTKETGFCGLGTAKTNVGHLDIAAGVTGLIKAALTVKHGVIPPLVHFETPNPKIDFSRSALFPVREKTDWSSSEAPRRAGVSALGVGGTNVHVILEEAPVQKQTPVVASRNHYFPLSATSPEALSATIKQLGTFVSTTNRDLSDIAFTLQEGRRQYDYRTVLSARTPAELADSCRTHPGKAVRRSPNFDQLAFLFPGQGAQHPGMARDLYENEPVFHSVLDECAAILEPVIGMNLIDLIVPPADKIEEMAATLRDTSLAQPAIFSVSYALAKQWQHWGIEPDALVGHSIGELAAATFAGVFELRDALLLIAKRGHLMSELPGGVMISVRATKSEIEPFLSGAFDLAAINGEKALVLAGPYEGAEQLEADLEKAGFVTKRLHTSHAFHSRMMDSIVAKFEEAVRAISLRIPQRRIFSTVKVAWLSDADATDPGYWSAHLREPVRFYDAISNLRSNPSMGFLEVGPGNTLATLAAQDADRKNAAPSLASLPHPAKEESAHQHLLNTAANLWSHGWKTDWARLEERGEASRRRVPLPTYPFQRERYWVEPPLDVPVEMLATEHVSEAVVETKIEAVALPERDEKADLQRVFSELSGLEPADIATDATFLELGLDSLLLTQASRELQENFGVKITLRELIDAYSTIDALADHIKKHGSRPHHAVTPVPLLEAPVAKAEPVSAPALKLVTKRQSDLSPKQRHHIDDLVARYTARTAKSKALTEKYRKAHADPRTASGFNREWKEMVYQIVTEKSKGSRLLDVDGNEYIDILNGFGPGFLGHSPDFLLKAIEEQLHKGFEVGPNQEVAMEAAALFCEVTGNERTSFVCTGSEAVQAAMRLSRTVTGRDKVVIFARDYHGNFDEVLVRGVNGPNGLKSLPVAPGIPKRAAGDMIVLPYGTDESLSIIRQMAGELAAVIVEPVQSRRPEFRPRDFIREVREITRASGTLFVFDEVVTGFRFGPGGAQDYYGVDADLATYGKVVGGGMPVGVVSGKAEYMDTFDGGDWSYGDDSFPEKPVTFFAGTFVRHPLVMASLRAMLTFFKEQPLHFWQAMNAKGDRLAGTVDRFFKDHELPYELPNRGSLMYARVGEDQPFGNLLFYHLRERGVFLLEGFPSYLTASHTEEDLDYVIDAFRDSAQELQEAGFFPDSKTISSTPPAAPASPTPYLSAGKTPPTAPELNTFSVPTTQPQREIVVASAMSADASCAFNESASLIFEGTLDVDALRQAVDELTHRHDALRATFSEDGTKMRVHRESGVDFQISPELEPCLREEAATPFNLQRGPLMRMRLIGSGDKHTLVMTAHHAIVDGWSYNVIAEELSTLYNAVVSQSGTKIRFPEPKQYAAHALEQLNFERTDTYAEQKAFWLRQFETLPAPIELPLDRPYPSERSFSGGTVSHHINEATYRAIKSTGAKQGATLYGTLSAVFALLLHRLSGQNELVYCIPAAGQNIGVDTANLIGHCVNFLPLRSRLVKDDSFSDFLKRNRDTFLAATDHRSYTYGELIRDLKVARDPRRMPLSEIAFNVERMDYFGEWTGLKCRFVPNPKARVHYTMFLNIVESDTGLRLDFDYNGDILDRTTVERWALKFEGLVQAIAAGASSGLGIPPVAKLPILTEKSRKLLATWSGSADQPKHFRSIPEVFSEAVSNHSGKTALVNSGAILTYAGLDEASTAAAAHLQSFGVTRGDRVALIADRSVELVVSLLGILKAGAAYVPIDPAYPAQRIEMMLADSGAKVLITDRSISFEDVAVVKTSFYQKSPAPVFTPVPLDGEDVAYVIYTSGSTGKPKGSLIPHRGVVRLVHETDYIHFGADEVFLLSSPVSFDASTLELWGPLLNGGRLALLPPGTPGLAELGAAIREFGVTTLWLTAGLFQLMVDERLKDLRPLRQLLVGGDVVSKSHARRALEALGSEGRLFNGYGPTENTTFTTVHPVTAADTAGVSIPIGKPIAGTKVYILDEHMNPVPPGVRGRLYFGGAGLSRGYLNDEERTTAAFVPNPFSNIPGSRLYDSGDQGRWRSDGTIEFCGRIDDQVKIRGFRIETGEIEAALGTYPGVKDVSVVVTGEDADSKTLNAFLLAESSATLDCDLVVHHARERLPAYMIPNRILLRKEFPLTANGKVDYRVLKEEAARSLGGPRSGVTAVPPQGKTEIIVAELWREILKVDVVSRRDDFFDLGGHSLAGLRLFTRLQSQFGIALPLATLFQSSTVEALSARIDECRSGLSRESGGTKLLTMIRPGNSEEAPLFLVHAGDGGTLFYKNFADHLQFQGEIYTIEAPILIDPKFVATGTDMAKTAALYLEGIRTLYPGRTFHLGGYSFGGAVAYEMASQLENSDTPVESLLLFDTPNPAREREFKHGFSSRLLADWRSRNDKEFLRQVQRFGVRLFEGFQSKLEYLNHIRALKKEHGQVLELPEHLKILKIQEMHRRLMESYDPAPYGGRAYLFRALMQSGAYHFNRNMGWNNLIANLEIFDVTGDHETIFNEPNVRLLSRDCSKLFAKETGAVLPG